MSKIYNVEIFDAFYSVTFSKDCKATGFPIGSERCGECENFINFSHTGNGIFEYSVTCKKEKGVE